MVSAVPCVANSGGRKCEPADARYLRARKDHRGAHAWVPEGEVVGHGEGRVTAIGLPCDRDPRRVDETSKGARARSAGGKHAGDHKAHVGGLIDQIGLIRSTAGVGVLKREHGCGDDKSRPGPALQQARVERRRDGKAVSEDDKRKWAVGTRRRRVEHVGSVRRSERWVADIGEKRSWFAGPVRELDRATDVNQPEHA